MWQELLARAAEAWAAETRGYRDGVIRVGLLLHEYVLARLAGADGATDYARHVGGYVGSSTRGEIDYAHAHGKPVRYLEPDRTFVISERGV